jgi:hypothetical protein
MLPNTILRKASPHVLLVLLLVLGALTAGCSRPVAPAPTPQPISTPSATPVPTSGSAPIAPRMIVADFDNCTGTNNLGGPMGAAYNAPDTLKESYPQEPNHGCIARLEYRISGWAGFWMKLQGADMSPFNTMVFDVRADPQLEIPGQIKLELKRPGEVSIKRVSGIGAEWRTISVKLSDFGYAGYGKPVSSWQGMEELVVVFEADKSGPQGEVFLDNLNFVR